MPIASTDIKFRLSGGASNANPLLSLGGAKSSIEVSPAALFDTVSEAESVAGDFEYRCFYVHNAHPSLTLESVVAWLSANTSYAKSDLAIGVGTSAVGGAEQTVANEGAAPAGVAFIAAATVGAGVSAGNLAPGAHRALWLRRAITAGAAPTTATTDSAELRIDGGYTE